MILLIDGGITVMYIITQITKKVYDKIIQKYMKNIPNRKRLNSEHKFKNFMKLF